MIDTTAALAATKQAARATTLDTCSAALTAQMAALVELSGDGLDVSTGMSLISNDQTGETSSGDMIIASGTSEDGTSGSLNFYSGDSTGENGTGSVILYSGDSALGSSGAVRLFTGNTVENTSGGVFLVTGEATGTTNSTGIISFETGRASDGGTSGDITFLTGSNGTQTGSLTLVSGIPAVDSNSGFVSFFSGNATGDGNSGVVEAGTGTTADGTSGTVTITSGFSTSGSSGNFTIASGGSGGNSGTFTLSTGETDATSGDVYLHSGPASTASGTVRLSTGTGNVSGNVIIGTANGSAGNSGGVEITTGHAYTGTAGDIVLGAGTGDVADGNIILSGAKIFCVLSTTDPATADALFNANDFVAVSGAAVTTSSSVLVGSPVSLVSTTAKDVTTISLTAGKWLIHGNVAFVGAGATTMTRIGASINTTTNTMSTVAGQFANQYLAAATLTTIGQDPAIGGFMAMVEPAITTTYRLIAVATFGASTLSAYGSLVAIPVR